MIINHLKYNLRFFLVFTRDTFLCLFFRKKILSKHNYSGNLFNNPSSKLYEDIDLVRSKLANLCSDNFFSLTYNQTNKFPLINNYILGSKFIQMFRWYYLTSFGKKINEKVTKKYYQGFIEKPYCGFLKLNNKAWIEDRFKQFIIINDTFNKKKLSYIEVGGASGLLPLFAAYQGYKRVVNSDLSLENITLSEQVARKLGLLNFEVVSNVQNFINDQIKFDVVSCHQVIEHTITPIEFVKDLIKLKKEDGIIILSDGYHLPVYPGHIPLEKSMSIKKIFDFCNLKVTFEDNGTYYLK